MKNKSINIFSFILLIIFLFTQYSFAYQTPHFVVCNLNDDEFKKHIQFALNNFLEMGLYLEEIVDNPSISYESKNYESKIVSVKTEINDSKILIDLRNSFIKNIVPFNDKICIEIKLSQLDSNNKKYNHINMNIENIYINFGDKIWNDYYERFEKDREDSFKLEVEIEKEFNDKKVTYIPWSKRKNSIIDMSDKRIESIVFLNSENICITVSTGVDIVNRLKTVNSSFNSDEKIILSFPLKMKWISNEENFGPLLWKKFTKKYSAEEIEEIEKEFGQNKEDDSGK